MTNPLENGLAALDRLHVVERMKTVFRNTRNVVLTDNGQTTPEAQAILADHGFSAEDIKQYGYAATAALGAEAPDEALQQLAALAQESRINGSAQLASKVTEADEWDRIAKAVQAQRDGMNERTKAVSDHMTRLADALIAHGHGLRQAHADRMAEASDCEAMADGLEKKYSKTVGTLAPSKG